MIFCKRFLNFELYWLPRQSLIEHFLKFFENVYLAKLNFTNVRVGNLTKKCHHLRTSFYDHYENQLPFRIVRATFG